MQSRRFEFLGGVAKNILRLRKLVNIISKQSVIVPEHKFRALLSYST